MRRYYPPFRRSPNDVPDPKYRRHKSGQAIVRLSGRDYYLGKHGTPESRIKYDQLVHTWKANHCQPLPAPPPPAPSPPAPPSRGITVAEVCLEYLDWIAGEGAYPPGSDGRPSAEPIAVKSALRPLADLYGRCAVADFGPLKLEEVQREMIRRGWTRKSINRQLGRLRAMFKWAVAKEKIPAGVYERIRTVSGLREGRTNAKESEPVKPVPRPMIEAVFPFVSRPVRAMIDLQLLTGMRPGEVCRMRAVDILRRGTAGAPWEYIPPRHKTLHHGHTRKIFLGPKAQKIITEFLRPDLQGYLFSPRQAEIERNIARRATRTSYLSPSARNAQPEEPAGQGREVYRAGTYRQAILRACDKAFPPPPLFDQFARRAGEGVAAWRSRITDEDRAALAAWRKAHHWHPHQLRHNAATALRAKYGLEIAGTILGHKSLAMTQLYAEQDAKAAERVMAEIG